ncbi:MAG: branched-chain amino acid ABC transporter substrate-binding protein [Brachymonas sp.]
MQFKLRMSVVATMVLASMLASCGKKDQTASSSASGDAGAAPGELVVKIASVAPMSGSQAHYGKDNANGVQMAVDEANKQGVTIGGKKVHFVAVLEDDAADPKQGTAVAQKLCDAKVAGVVGHLNSGTTIPASKIYNDCGLPMVTGAATNPALTKPGYKNVFRIIANDNVLGAALADEAKKLGLKRVAVIDDRTAYGQGIAEIFTQTAKKNGMEVVSTQFTNDKATDFMAILTAVKAQTPDAVFYGGMDAQAGPMLRQMAQLGLDKAKFFGGDGICTNELVKLSGGAKPLGNVICGVGGASLTKMKGGAEWRKSYDAKFPNQFQVYSPYTYDATMLLIDAMKKADSVDPKVYLPKLAAEDYQGVTGKITFDDKGEVKDAATTLFHYPDNKKQEM